MLVGRFRAYWNFSRPFTLVPPMIGIFSGALIGYAATRVPLPVLHVVVAIAAAGVLNAGSNALNQIFDVAIDRVNKPARALAAGELTIRQAGAFAAVLYTAALFMAATVNAQVFAIYLVAAAATVAYSAPPVRLKRRPWASNLVIALVRGELLKVAGWAAVASVLASWEPWYIGSIYFLFLAGATTTKDFADLEGDRAAGCVTLPIKYGIETSVRLISPGFMVPWIVLALGEALGILHASRFAAYALSAVLLAWGAWVVQMLRRNPQSLAERGENHPAWRQMYWMMMAGHLGLAGAYLLRVIHLSI